jgi:hypothetical protein
MLLPFFCVGRQRCHCGPRRRIIHLRSLLLQIGLAGLLALVATGHIWTLSDERLADRGVEHTAWLVDGAAAMRMFDGAK